MTTDAQIQANRRNAEHSTGPRSSEGKSASASNALKHGAYASRPIAIPRGDFAEDEDEVAAFVNDVVASLEPRDRIETEAAQRIATLFLRLRRLSQFEAEAIAGDSPTRSYLNDIPDPFHNEDEKSDVRREQGALHTLQRSVSLVTSIDARTATALEKASVAYERLQRRVLTITEVDQA